MAHRDKINLRVDDIEACQKKKDLHLESVESLLNRVDLTIPVEVVIPLQYLPSFIYHYRINRWAIKDIENSLTTVVWIAKLTVVFCAISSAYLL